MSSEAGGYDVIIVGAGSGGGSLAARLTDQGRSVLLLEAGPVYDSIGSMPQAILDPADLSNALPGGPNNWSLFGALTDSVKAPVPRGKGMGGSSSINGAYFIRGLPENFDAWAAMGHDEWSFDKVLPYFKRSESEKDFPDDDRHGTDGPIPVKREPIDRAPVFTEAFTASTLALGYELEPDKNAPKAGGVGPVPMNIDGGRRVGTALGYLIPRVGSPNLHLRGNAFVHRVLFDGGRAVGVEAAVDGQPQTFHADEVVLAAGAFRTPQLLMISGIGPAAHLGEHGIEVRVDLPGVGEHLTDHPELSTPWNFKGKHRAMPGRGALTSVLHWTAEGSDRPSDMEVMPFVGTPAAMMHLAGAFKHPLETLKMMRKTSPQLVIAQARAARLPFVVIGLQQEDSRGRMTLASANPEDSPVLNWNLFAEESDRRRFREAIRVTHEVFDTGPMHEIGASLVGLSQSDLESESALNAWMTSHVFAVGHAPAPAGWDRSPTRWRSSISTERCAGSRTFASATSRSFPRSPRAVPTRRRSWSASG